MRNKANPVNYRVAFGQAALYAQPARSGDYVDRDNEQVKLLEQAMAIYRHPDGSYRRFPPGAVPAASPGVDPHEDKEGWTQVAGAPLGVEVYRDGKTMRNKAPTPPAK